HLVGPGGRELPAGGMEGQGVDGVERVREREEPPARGHVPDLHGAVTCPRGQPLAVGTEGYRKYGVGVLAQCRLLDAARHVPEADGLVVAGCGEQETAGRAEGRLIDVVAVSLDRADARAGRRLPEHDLAAARGDAALRGQPLSG